MRQAKISGKTITMNERDYNQLLRRFDPERLKKGTVGIKCICDKHNCSTTCPFAPLKPSLGCMRMIEEIVPGLGSTVILYDDYYTCRCPEDARPYFQKITDHLLSIPKS